MESGRIADLVRGGILLAIAALMLFLLWKVFHVLPAAGISIKRIFYFPIAIVAAVCWLCYRGISTILAAFRNTD